MTSVPSHRLLQRVVMPEVHDPDILPLYVDADFWTTLPVYEDRAAKEAQRGFIRPDTDRATVRLSDFGVLSAIRGRDGFAVPHRRKVSFGTYFNAFPASYWRRWTSVSSVLLEVRTRGRGQVLVYRSNARGVVQRVDSRAVEGDSILQLDLGFTMFGDGGWYWFDLLAEEDDFGLVEAGWYAPDDCDPPRGSGSVSLAITTMNRVSYVLELLATIGRDASVLELIDRIYLVDQGSDKVSAAPGFGEVLDALAGKLAVIDQHNLGGSGGFSRGMYETVVAGESDFVLVIDDDVMVEPEGIRRAVRFADYALEPTIVGGHMFDMYDKTKLHAFAEGFDFTNFMWGPKTPSRHDLATSNLRQTRWMHRRIDAEYNGWWMCLIPVSIIREIGLSLPVFIKWDDAEFALRAKSRGYDTVSLPGAAVWHVSWVDKDDSIDWQAFFHARNRLVAAMLHSPMEQGGRLNRANLAIDLKHLLSMQYFAMAARLEAYKSVLDGPDSLHDDLRTRLPAVRSLMTEYSDGVALRERDSLPPIIPQTPEDRTATAHVYQPRGWRTVRWLLHHVPKHALRRPRHTPAGSAEAHLPYEDARWWVVPGFDSVLVSNAEGSGAYWLRRDPRTFRAMFWRSVVLRRRIRRRWDSLAAEYRHALPDMVSLERWRQTFDSR